MRDLRGALTVLVGTALLSTGARGDGASPIVVRVGSRTAVESAVMGRFAQLSEAQRRRLGDTPIEQCVKLVENGIVVELLMAEAGVRGDLGQRPGVLHRQKETLAAALVEQRRKVVEKQVVSDADVKGFYAEHPELFGRGERRRLWRILVEKEDEARELIGKTQALTTTELWRNLAREKSVDRATAERGGDLGFVEVDGSTSIPELRVDEALYAAASRVKDGEVVPEAVAEGSRYAVLWRRGTVPATTTTVEQEGPRIREFLVAQRARADVEQLVAGLRESRGVTKQPKLLDDATWQFQRNGEPSAASPRSGAVDRTGPTQPAEATKPHL